MIPSLMVGNNIFKHSKYCFSKHVRKWPGVPKKMFCSGRNEHGPYNYIGCYLGGVRCLLLGNIYVIHFVIVKPSPLIIVLLKLTSQSHYYLFKLQ